MLKIMDKDTLIKGNELRNDEMLEFDDKYFARVDRIFTNSMIKYAAKIRLRLWQRLHKTKM